MNTKDTILKFLNEKKEASGKELVSFLDISRQALNKHLKSLIQDGLVLRDGKTRGATYRLASGEKISVDRFKANYALSGLEEDKVFQEIALRLGLRDKLSLPVFEIANYAFTEMLNNAIDHSGSPKCSIEMTLDQYDLNFSIREVGIGLFHSISDKFELENEGAAILELLKGKKTTMAKRHSGEGIFFTSKSGDLVSYRSHKTHLEFDNVRDNTLVEDKRFIEGTLVSFRISRNSMRRLEKIFLKFAPEEFDYEFGKTRVLVRLLKKDCVSRSEAKRLLLGLDKFKEVKLDFKGVKSIGQGFADEIFRVFQEAHPETQIAVSNLSESLKPMLEHVRG